MAIKIPRGEIQMPSVARNTNMMDLATVGSRSATSSLSSLASTLFELDKVNKAHNEKVRNQEIINKNTENKSLLTSDKDDFIFNLKENGKLNTEGDYQKSYEKWANDTLNKYQKKYENEKDQEAWDRFKSDFYSIVNVDAKKEMRDTRNKKILAKAEVNHDAGIQSFKNDIDKLPVSENIFLAKDYLLKKEKDRQVNVGTVLGADKVNYAEQEKYANEKIWKKILSSDKKYLSDMDDKEYTNYQKIIEELKTDKDKKYFGQGLDEDMRQTLLDWAETEMNDQKTYFTNRDARMDVDNTKDINTNMDKWINGQGIFQMNGQDVTAEIYFKKTIPTLKVTQKTKEALYKKVEEITKDKKEGASSDTYGSPVAINEYFEKIVTGQAKDAQFTLNVTGDERLTGKGKEWVLSTSKKWNEDLDENSKQSLTDFLKPYERDVNALAEKLEKVSPKSLNIYSQLSRQVKLTTLKLLADGEKAGISYNSMLNDIQSPYYIGFKIQQIYNIGLNDITEALKVEEFNYAKFWIDKQNQALSYFVDADPDTEGYQLYKGFEAGADVDAQGYLKGEIKQTPIGDPAKFFERKLAKPKPPSYTRADGTKIPIAEYETSPEYQKYLQDYRLWLDKGGFNSKEIPSIMKSTLGFSDLIKTK
jgi:hypothetical protein